MSCSRLHQSQACCTGLLCRARPAQANIANEEAPPLPSLFLGLHTSLQGGAAVKKLAADKAAKVNTPSLVSTRSSEPQACWTSATDADNVSAISGCLVAQQEIADDVQVRACRGSAAFQHVEMTAGPMQEQNSLRSICLAPQGGSVMLRAGPVAEHAWAILQVAASTAWEQSQAVSAQAAAHGRDISLALAQHSCDACVAVVQKAGEIAAQSWPHVCEATDLAGHHAALAVHHSLNKIEGCLVKADGDDDNTDDEEDTDDESSDDEAQEGSFTLASGSRAQSQIAALEPRRQLQSQPADRPWQTQFQQHRSAPSCVVVAPAAMLSPYTPASAPLRPHSSHTVSNIRSSAQTVCCTSVAPLRDATRTSVELTRKEVTVGVRRLSPSRVQRLGA